MNLLLNGYFQDGFKAIVYLIPLIYIVLKRNELKLKFFWLFCLGLAVLFLGHFIDFLDEFAALSNIPSIANHYLLCDFFEDIVGFTLGFIIFIAALFLEFKYIKKNE